MLVEHESAACAGSVATNGAAATNCLAAIGCIVWGQRPVNDLVYQQQTFSHSCMRSQRFENDFSPGQQANQITFTILTCPNGPSYFHTLQV